MLTERILFILIPFVLLAIAILGVRRYAPLNIARVGGGSAFVWVFVIASGGPSIAIDPPVLILLAAIAATLVGQGFEAERQRARDRLVSIGVAAPRGS